MGVAMKPTRDDLAKVRLAASKGRRSTLFLWLRENHDDFAAAVAEAGQPNWEELSVTFSDLGLTDRLNHPPTPEGARQTWWRVRKTVAAIRQKTQPVTSDTTVQSWEPTARQPIPTTLPPTPLPLDNDDDDFVLRAGDGTILNPKKPK